MGKKEEEVVTAGGNRVKGEVFIILLFWSSRVRKELEGVLMLMERI